MLTAGGGWRNTHPILQVNWGSECDFIIGPGPLSVTAQNPLQGCSSPGRVFLIFLVATEAIKGKGAGLCPQFWPLRKFSEGPPWCSMKQLRGVSIYQSIVQLREFKGDILRHNLDINSTEIVTQTQPSVLWTPGTWDTRDLETCAHCWVFATVGSFCLPYLFPFDWLEGPHFGMIDIVHLTLAFAFP